MEEDRAIANLGEDSEDAQSEKIPQELKTPRRRFVGRRAAAERAASQAAPNEQSNEDAGKQLQAHRPPTAARTLNRIPDSILKDESLNAAIAHIPSNYNFEIQKTVHRIRESGAKNVALQFPEGLLIFAPLISDIVTEFCPGTETLIMGDVTYGACCIDDYTARALGCDLLVHYGHSCLVPIDTTKGIKTLYVFVTIGVDTEHLLATIEQNFQPGKKIALVGTIQFNATIHSIAPRLRSLGIETLLPRSSPLSAGEILGCTAPTLTASSQKISASQKDADMILYVGDGRFHLESIMIASPTLRSHTYRYDPYSRRLTHETYEHEEMHSMRRAAIRAARQTLRNPTSPAASGGPRTWGIILGTLGRQGNPNTLGLIETHLARRGITCVTLLLSEVMPAKLALMSAEVGVWVQIACPRLSIDWGYAFERPLLSPYEALVALDVKEGSTWKAVDSEVPLGEDDKEAVKEAVGVYPMDFYERSGLGRTRKEDIPMEIEVK